MSDKILSTEEIARIRESSIFFLELLLDSHEALRAERDAAREEAQRWVQIARAALAAAQTQEPTDPVKT